MNALAAFFQSRKTQRVLLGALSIIGSLYLMWPTFTTPTMKMTAYVSAMVSIAGLLGIDIHAIAKEDAAKSVGQQPTQVNVNSDVKNTPAPSAPTPPPAVVTQSPQPSPVAQTPFPAAPVLVTTAQANAMAQRAAEITLTRYIASQAQPATEPKQPLTVQP